MSGQQEDTFTPLPGFDLADITLQPDSEAPGELHAELATLRAQAECLLQELHLCQQTANEQQKLIETLATQLQQSQQQVERLEHHQSFQQKRLQEQEAALIQEQQQRQELEARYYRQQQENLHLRHLLHTYAPNTDWERHARLYQQPIPPWRVPATSEPEPPESASAGAERTEELLTQTPVRVQEDSGTPPRSGKKFAVDLPVFVKN